MKPCLSLQEIETVSAPGTPGEVRTAHLSHLESCTTCAALALELTSARTVTSSVDPSPDIESGEAHAPSDLVPGHELLEERARGGQGVVWKALQIATRRTVAIKLYPRASISSARARLRFEREAELLGRLRHPGIVTVHDAGVADGWPYLVTEWVDGLPIDEHVRTRQLSLRDGLQLFVAACRAVHAAHQRQVLHLDIKPSNILVDAQGPRVLDFGVSRFVGGGRGSERGFAGTLSRAAPEQVAGDQDLDVRTDVYSLGLLLHELVTGERWPGTRDPFSVAELVRERLHQSCATRDGADCDLDAIVRCAASADREQRYASAEDLARDVENWLAGRPLDALAHDRWHVLRKTTWTHRWLLASMASIMLAASTGLVMVVRSAATAERQRDAAIAAETRAQQAATKARQVADLLLATFEAASPLDTDGAKVTAREVLDAGRRRLESDTSLDTSIRAELWQTMGRAYEGIGLLAEAEQVLQVAADTSAPALATGEDQAAAIAADLARVQRVQGAFERAAATTEAALGRMRAASRSSGSGLGFLVVEQGLWHVDKGPPERGLTLVTEGLKLLTHALGPADPEVADAHNSLGLALMAADRPADAAREFRRTEQMLAAAGPRWTARAITSQANLAAALSNAGQLEAATPAFEEALARSSAVLGPEHPKHLEVASNFAGHLYRAAQHARAVELLTSVLATQRRVLGERHPRVAKTCDTLAANLVELRRLDEAEALFREEISILEEVFGPKSVRFAHALANLASVYQRRGQHEKARDLLLQAASIQRASSPEPTSELLATLDVLGVCYLYLGDLNSAATVLRECADGRRVVLGESHPAYANSLVNLAAVLKKLGKLDEALVLQVQAVDVCRRALPPEHPLLAQALHNLAVIRLAGSDLSSARAAAEEAVRLREAHRGPDNPETLESLVVLCRVLESAGDALALESTARKALAIVEKIEPSPAAKLGEIKSLLGLSLLQTDRQAGLSLLRAGSEMLVAASGAKDAQAVAATARLERAARER